VIVVLGQEASQEMLDLLEDMQESSRLDQEFQKYKRKINRLSSIVTKMEQRSASCAESFGGIAQEFAQVGADT
jgi:hypothetical protein